MAKDYTRRNRLSEQFAARPIRMLESPAYSVLSLGAHRALARIEVELAHHGGRDNGKLPVTFEQFSEFGMDRHAVAPAVRELGALGFIEVTERGRAGNADWRRPNKFRLTYRNVDRAKETNEWDRIKTIEDARMIAKAARRRGRNSLDELPDENICQWGYSPSFSGGNPHRKPDFHSGETPTTGHSGETPTTSRLSGRVAQDEAGSLPPASALSAPASASSSSPLSASPCLRGGRAKQLQRAARMERNRSKQRRRATMSRRQTRRRAAKRGAWFSLAGLTIYDGRDPEGPVALCSMARGIPEAVRLFENLLKNHPEVLVVEVERFRTPSTTGADIDAAVGRDRTVTAP